MQAIAASKHFLITYTLSVKKGAQYLYVHLYKHPKVCGVPHYSTVTRLMEVDELLTGTARVSFPFAPDTPLTA